jgi:hypothetical protein
MINPSEEEKRLVAEIGDLLNKGHQFRTGIALTNAGPGAEIPIRLDGATKTLRAKAANRIDQNSKVLVFFSFANKEIIAVNPTPPEPGKVLKIEQSRHKQEKKGNKKDLKAIVPMLVSKTVGEELEEKPECTCTHYVVGKVTGSKAFTYETCDGTVPGASKDKEALEQSSGLSKVYYWCFNSWNVNSTIPWINSGLPVCEEPYTPRNPDLDIYGSRQQRFKLNPFQPNLDPRTPVYSASNMYLLEIGPLNQYFTNPINPESAELFLHPEVQDNIWGFHLVADEQPIITSTGKKFSIRPTILTSIPILTPPISAIANAQAWRHFSAFGGIVKLITNQGTFNTSGWIVAFGEPVDCWYDENDQPSPPGVGRREIGVTLRSFGYWNRVPWQLVVDPAVCPQEPLIENMLNEPPKDPEDPNKYLMTKWFVGGITEQWLELPVKHRADDPHYALISCNSEKNKIWVSIKTGLDPLNTYEEKAEWFKDPNKIINTNWIEPKSNGKIRMGSNLHTKNNYLFPDDEIKRLGITPDYTNYFEEDMIFSSHYIQFANHGARFCKIQLIEIDIADNGNLSVNNKQIFKYEEKALIASNVDNWKHLDMVNFLAFLGNITKTVPPNYSGRNFVGGLNSSYQIQSGLTPSYPIGIDYWTDTEGEESNEIFPLLSTQINCTNPFLSSLLGFFGSYNNYGIGTAANNKEGYIFENLKISDRSKKELIAANSILAANFPVFYLQEFRNFLKVSNFYPFLPFNILGITNKQQLMKSINLDRGDVNNPVPTLRVENLTKIINKVLYQKPYGCINYPAALSSTDQYSNNLFQLFAYDPSGTAQAIDACFLFWDKAEFKNLLESNIAYTESEYITKRDIARTKRGSFFEKKKGYESLNYLGDNFYEGMAVGANLSKGKLCCFDFYRGYPNQNLKLSPLYIPSLFNELAFSDKPIECPVYVCDFDSNDELVNYNIYAGKVANAVVYPFDYTEGEPCSFTVWGAAPALVDEYFKP